MSIKKFTELEGVWLDGTDRFRLTKPFFYYVGEISDGDDIIVPAGFTTDFASIPKCIWSLTYHPAESEIRNAAVLHDFIY